MKLIARGGRGIYIIKGCGEVAIIVRVRSSTPTTAEFWRRGVTLEYRALSFRSGDGRLSIILWPWAFIGRHRFGKSRWNSSGSNACPIRSSYCNPAVACLRESYGHVGSGRLDESNNNDRRKSRIGPAHMTATISAATTTSNERPIPCGRRHRMAELKKGRVELCRLIDRPLDVYMRDISARSWQSWPNNNQRPSTTKAKLKILSELFDRLQTPAIGYVWKLLTAWKTLKRGHNLSTLWFRPTWQTGLRWSCAVTNLPCENVSPSDSSPTEIITVQAKGPGPASTANIALNYAQEWIHSTRFHARPCLHFYFIGTYINICQYVTKYRFLTTGYHLRKHYWKIFTI